MSLSELLVSMRACSACEGLPLGPKPIFQIDPRAPILIVGQAPGRLTHAKGIPFDDPSGNRLRQWLGVTREEFYDPAKFAIFPMGLCFPGTAKGGDLPPRPECAPLWRARVLKAAAEYPADDHARKICAGLASRQRPGRKPHGYSEGLADALAASASPAPSQPAQYKLVQAE